MKLHKASCFILFLSAFLFLTSCGKSTEVPDTPQPSDPMFPVTIEITCAKNLLFSKYDIVLEVDGKEVATLDHGGEGTYLLELKEGQHTLRVHKQYESSVDGKTDFVVLGDTNLQYKVTCSKSQVEIESVDNSSGEAPSQGEESLETTEDPRAETNDTTPSVSVLANPCEEKISAIVAEHNGTINNISTTEHPDGLLVNVGILCANSEEVVNSIISSISSYVTTLSDTHVIALFGETADGDALVLSVIEPDGSVENTVMSSGYHSAYNDWVASLFSAWDGSCPSLTSAIKECLNDEKSYKHKETRYYLIASEEVMNETNELLKSIGCSDRVEVNDVFIQIKFTAKNGFNATIKNTAYGIASYSKNAVKLITIV